MAWMETTEKMMTLASPRTRIGRALLTGTLAVAALALVSAGGPSTAAACKGPSAAASGGKPAVWNNETWLKAYPNGRPN